MTVASFHLSGGNCSSPIWYRTLF